MSHFADELRAEGFEVDYRRAPSLRQGLRDHRLEFSVDQVVAMEPMSWDGRAMLVELGVQLVRNAQFLCQCEDFAEWAGPRKHIKRR